MRERSHQTNLPLEEEGPSKLFETGSWREKPADQIRASSKIESPADAYDMIDRTKFLISEDGQIITVLNDIDPAVLKYNPETKEHELISGRLTESLRKKISARAKQRSIFKTLGDTLY